MLRRWMWNMAGGSAAGLLFAGFVGACVVDSGFLEGKPCGEGDACAQGYTCVREACGEGYLCSVCRRHPQLEDGGSDGLDGSDGTDGEDGADAPSGCQAVPPACLTVSDCTPTDAECIDDGWVCPGAYETPERSCDGLDNDCDGEADRALICVLAGDAQAGLVDGPGDVARFDRPRGLLALAAGDLLVADQGNHAIRRVTGEGAVQTAAGTGASGYQDGPALTAMFKEPTGLALAADGAVLVADSGNHRIRRLAPDGLVSTVAGSGFVDYLDGPTDDARFAFPSGLAVTPEGVIYVADKGNHCIRKIESGQVSTFSGLCEIPGLADGPPGQARFNSPSDLLLLIDGSLLVTEESSHRIRWIAPDGTVSTLAGTGEYGYRDGDLEQALFRTPSGMAADASGGIILIADSGNNRIRSLSAVVGTVLGAGPVGDADGPAGLVEFNHPMGLAYLGDGRLVVADTYNNRLRVQNP